MGEVMQRIYLAWLRFEKRTAHRLIRWLSKRYFYHDTILDTDWPNVPILKVVSLVVRNHVGQIHEWKAK